MNLLDRLVEFPDEASWVAARSGIGGSDVGRMLGVLGFPNAPGPVEFLAELRGEKPPEDLSQKPSVWWGNQFEDPVAQAWWREMAWTEGTLRRCQWTKIYDLEYPDIFSVTPDYLVLDRTTGTPVCGLEIKTTGWFQPWLEAAGLRRKDVPSTGRTLQIAGVPASVNYQIQLAMRVTGLDVWYVAAYVAHNMPLLWAKVHRNEKMIQRVITTGLDMWKLAGRG